MKDHSIGTNTQLLCPVDRELIQLNQVFADKGIARTVGNLRVRCGYQEQGCLWVDDLRQLQQHQDKCTYGVQQYMSNMSVRSTDNDALLKELLLRVQKCEESIILKEKEMHSKNKDIAQLKYCVK